MILKYGQIYEALLIVLLIVELSSAFVRPVLVSMPKQLTVPLSLHRKWNLLAVYPVFFDQAQHPFPLQATAAWYVQWSVELHLMLVLYVHLANLVHPRHSRKEVESSHG